MELKRYMEKVYADSEEKFVTGIMLYHNSTDSILYYSYNASASTQYSNPVPKAELIDMFKKGLVLISVSGGMVRPDTLSVSENYSAVSVTTVGSSATAVTTSYYSEGYTAT